MARILLGWELGSGLGHVTTLLPIAKALAAQGHEPVLVLSNVVETWPLLQNSGFTILQAPVFYAREGSEAVALHTRSYADILAYQGYDDVETLEPMVRAWRQLLDVVQPELVLAEHAPTLCLASHDYVPVINIGTGFTVPHLVDGYFPLLNNTAEERVPFSKLNQNIQTVLQRLGKNSPDPAVRAVIGQQHFVTVYAEIDPYRESREAAAIGPLWSLPASAQTSSAQHSSTTQENMCLVYLPADHPDLEKLIDGLMSVPMPGIVYIRNASADILERLHQTPLTVSTAPLDLDALLPCVSVVLHHGGAGMMQRCLAYGLPQVIAPIYLEQQLSCVALQEMGVAIKLGGAFSAAQSGAAIGQAVRVPRLAHLAQMHAQNLRKNYPRGSLDLVVQICLQQLSRAASLSAKLPTAQKKSTSVAFVTTCKGRLQHLQQTLPMMVAEQPDEIVVVDYGCPQGAGDWVEENFPKIKFPHIKVVRVTDDASFNAARARNSGAAVVNSSWICFIDADICVQSGWVQWMHAQLRDEKNYYRSSGTLETTLHGPEVGGSYGTFILSRNAFEQVQCYDEVFKGWGGEDGDLYDRLASWGFHETSYPQKFVYAITHTNETRTQFYEEKDKNITHLAAQYYMAIKTSLMQQEGGELSLDVRQGIMNSAQSHVRDLIKNPTSTPQIAMDIFVRNPTWRVQDKMYEIRQQLVTSIANRKIKNNPDADAKKFCVMTFGRSGSTSLMVALQKYSDVAVPNKNIDCGNNELLIENKVDRHIQKYAELVNKVINNPQELIEQFYNYNNCYGYVGFKSMPNRHPDLKDFVLRDDIQFITLIREDIASTVASFMYAERTGAWGRTGEQHESSWWFDESEIGERVVGNLAYVLQSYAAIRSIPNAIALTYEELCDPAFNNQGLDNFFERKISLRDPKPPTHGSTYVENWEEFSNFIARKRKLIGDL